MTFIDERNCLFRRFVLFLTCFFIQLRNPYQKGIAIQLQHFTSIDFHFFHLKWVFKCKNFFSAWRSFRAGNTMDACNYRFGSSTFKYKCVIILYYIVKKDFDLVLHKLRYIKNITIWYHMSNNTSRSTIGNKN